MARDEAVLQVELPGVPLFRRGKVRDSFDLGDTLLIVASDRISAFDVVMPVGIPNKGAILTRLSNFWFEHTADLVRNHLVATNVEHFPASLQPFASRLRGRAVLARKATRIDIECVVRGYLAGSAWVEYQQRQTVCDQPLPPGLVESERLPEPIFTPATKADEGHDQNISRAEMASRIGADLALELERLSRAIYAAAAAYAAPRGIIIADTKLEFGLVDDEPILIDELLTPDSSRFWEAERYAPGRAQDSLDKQPLRDWLLARGWNREPPAPLLPDAVVEKIAGKYATAYERLTGQPASVND